MLIKIGNAVVNSEDVVFAGIRPDENTIEVHFRGGDTPLSIKSDNAVSDLEKLEKCSAPR